MGDRLHDLERIRIIYMNEIAFTPNDPTGAAARAIRIATGQIAVRSSMHECMGIIVGNSPSGSVGVRGNDNSGVSVNSPYVPERLGRAPEGKVDCDPKSSHLLSLCLTVRFRPHQPSGLSPPLCREHGGDRPETGG